MSADAGADPNRSNSEVDNTPKKAREGNVIDHLNLHSSEPSPEVERDNIIICAPGHPERSLLRNWLLHVFDIFGCCTSHNLYLNKVEF
jgi:hypothetical protein